MHKPKAKVQHNHNQVKTQHETMQLMHQEKRSQLNDNTHAYNIVMLTKARDNSNTKRV